MKRNPGRIAGIHIVLAVLIAATHATAQVNPPAGPAIPNAPAAPAIPAVSPPPDASTANAPAQQPPPSTAQPVPQMPPTPPTGAIPETLPAFGPSALKAVESLEAPATPKPKPTPKPYEPSEVVTILPNQVKIGDPRAIVHTSLGEFSIHLFSGYAPETVRHFIELARGEKAFFDTKTGRSVQRPFYTNLIFHRVLHGYLIQTGCPFGNGRGGPGFSAKDEFSPVLQFDKPGIVAMAPQNKGKDTVKDSNGSQFFVSLRPMPQWDGKYTIFGEVDRGMDVVKKIANAKTGPTDRPIKRIFLFGIEIVDEPLRPKKPEAK